MLLHCFRLHSDGKKNSKTLNSVASTSDCVLIYPKFTKTLSFQHQPLKQKNSSSIFRAVPISSNLLMSLVAAPLPGIFNEFLNKQIQKSCDKFFKLATAFAIQRNTNRVI